MALHSSTLAWKIPWMEEPGRLQSMGSLRSDTTGWLHFHFSLSCTGEGNGNPLQCSCLGNPRDGGAWWAAVCEVAQSRTRLRQLSSSNPQIPANWEEFIIKITISLHIYTQLAVPCVWWIAAIGEVISVTWRYPLYLPPISSYLDVYTDKM